MRRVRKHDIVKLNNKGLSLVEVLVAVIIMSVVSIIFLRSFSYSMIINRDAEVRQDALTLGQSIMEAVKAYDMAKLDDEFQSGGAITIINNAAGATSQSASIDSTTNVRTYTLTEVPFANSKFDAEVVITPNTGLYSDTMLTIQDFHHYNDAYFRQDPYEQDTVRNEILSDLKNAGYTGIDLDSGANAGTAKITERKLTVNIFSDSGTDKVTVTSEYSYSASGYKKPDPLNPLNVVPISTITGTVTIPEYTVYSITGTEPSGVDAELETVYLFYYPAYYNVSGDDFLPCEKDTIDIDNSLSSLKSVYLVKQMHPLMMNALGTPDANMSNGEGSYLSSRVSVDVTSTANVIDLYSNIEDPLTSTGTPAASYNYSQCNNAKLPWAEDTTATPLIYDVVVTIKNSSNGKVECQLTGSTNHKRELDYTP